MGDGLVRKHHANIGVEQVSPKLVICSFELYVSRWWALPNSGRTDLLGRSGCRRSRQGRLAGAGLRGDWICFHDLVNYDVYRPYTYMFVLWCVFDITHLSEPCWLQHRRRPSWKTSLALPWSCDAVTGEAVKSVPLRWPQNITEAKTCYVWHCFDMVPAFSEANRGIGNEMHMSTGWLSQQRQSFWGQ